MKTYTGYQFALFRIILGIYLIFHFASLIMYAPEIWSNQGILPTPSLNLTYGYFPNLLNYYCSPIFVQAFVCIGLTAAISFTIGYKRQIVAAIVWYIWVCLLDRNNLISNPGIPFIGWILLACIATPKGEAWCLGTIQNKDWQMPKIIFYGSWIIMAVCYSISGYDKLQSPSWQNGTAIMHLLNNPLARDWGLRNLLLQLPTYLLSIFTWVILCIEISFLPFAIFKTTRKWIWLAMIVLHISILIIVNFADLTLGMLMIHWFTFDSTWLKSRQSAPQQHIVFFDGVCTLCNNFVDTLITIDTNDVLQYASLQGNTALEYLTDKNTKELKTVMYYCEGQLLIKSDAVLEILKNIGGVWKLAIVLKIIPKPIRDYVYDIIAKNRIKWFGQKETCRLPSAKDRGKMLG